jgi:hypothetical protein
MIATLQGRKQWNRSASGSRYQALTEDTSLCVIVAYNV